MAQRSKFRTFLPVIIVVFMVLVALPSDKKAGWAPGWLQAPSLHYGLDLAGGTQLDFRISEQEMADQITELKATLEQMKADGAPADDINLQQLQIASIEGQQDNIVEAIRTVLERRINAMGVSEAVITPSYFGNEKHLLVECPGVVDTQACIDTVGKTIKLEFKEEFTEATEEHEAKVTATVDAHLASLNEEKTLAILGEDLSGELGVAYLPEARYFKENLPEGLEDIWYQTPGNIIKRRATLLVPGQDSEGNQVEQPIEGLFLSELTRPRTSTGRVIVEAPAAFEFLAETNSDLSYVSQIDKDISTIDASIAGQLRSMTSGDLAVLESETGGSSYVLFLRSFKPGQDRTAASHILIAYQGATAANETVTRTKEEALTLAQTVKQRLNSGENFATLARELSDGPSGEKGGSLGEFGRTDMVKPFADVAFGLSVGQISDPVETAFGFHLIKSDATPQAAPDLASYEQLTVAPGTVANRAQEIVEQLQAGQVARNEEVVFVRSLFFSLLPTGWKDTALDGKQFTSASTTVDSYTGLPIVQITFNPEGAKLFQELTGANVGKRIAIFVGGELVSAPTVQTEIAGGIASITGLANFEEAAQLAQDLNTGAIPAPIYLSGQRTVEATLGAYALETSIKAALLGIAILMVYMIIMYRFLGLLANLALTAYAFIFFTFLKLPLFLFSSQYIVLSLAGMAGIILSIGMAVDANVLIFERMKEELRKGKLLRTAAETGFKRAWPSIRDGNMSTFITCVILFSFGTSIVRGFAVTLGMGILISMFSAVVITRWLIERTARTKLADNLPLFCGNIPKNL